MTEVEPGTKGLVIHKQFLKEDNSGILLECTLLKQHGVPCDSNQNVLIEIFGLEQFILKSRTNVVINEYYTDSEPTNILQPADRKHLQLSNQWWVVRYGKHTREYLAIGCQIVLSPKSCRIPIAGHHPVFLTLHRRRVVKLM